MADGLTLNAGSGGATLATDDIGGTHYQIVKLTYGALDSSTLVDTTNRFPTSAAQSGTWTVTGAGGTFPVTDSAGSLTVDAPVATPVFVRLSDGAAAISALPVTDNSGSLTVDGTVAATQSGTWTVQPGNTANTTAWLVTGTGGTFPATQSGTWSVRNQDGTGNAITSATRGSERALTVQVVDGSGNQVTSFSGSGTPSVVSSVNSTTATLGANAVFTGTSEDISAYASATVSLIASHASATDGLSIQQSSDGTNWDIADVYTIPAATGKTFGVQVAAKFFRIVYTNGGTIQTSFRLQTIFHTVMPNASSVRPQDARSNENDMQEVIGYAALYNGTTWDRMRGDTTNGLDVDVTRVPTDPFGANADAASATGSISAKLRFIAATGIPITGTVTVGTHAVTQSGTWTVQPGNTANTTAWLVTGTGGTFPATQSGTWTVQPGNTANTTAWLVNDQPATSGGLSFSAVPVSAANNNKTQAKGSAGQLYSISAQNISASPRYLKIFNNTSAGVTMGTTACDYQFIIPGNASGSGLNVNFDKGIAMGTGITYAITGAISATDNTSIGASEVSVLIGYK